MFIENIADYLQKLKKRDIKPEIFTVFEFPDDLTILEILNSIGYRLANLFGFVKINTTTKTVDTGEASVNVTGDVDNLNFDFTIPRGKDGAQGPTGPGVATGGTTGQVLAKKSDANYDTEWIDNAGGGSTVSVNVGETTTGKPGTNANVTNSGDETNAVLNFTIPRGDPGPENLVIITATASTTVQGKYIPDTTYTKALADIQANKAVMIKLENVPGRYYIPYSSSNTEILASAGTVSGSNQSIELYLLKWAAQGNIITLAGTKEGCIADGGTTGQVLAKKSDANYDTEWIDVPNSGGLTKTILWTNPNPQNEMAGTQIALSDFITNYELITIEYLLSTTLQKVITTVYNKNTNFTETRLYYYDGYRDVKMFGQTLFVTNGWNLKTNVSDKTQVIPLRIVAYN